jgi:hypothetical protein
MALFKKKIKADEKVVLTPPTLPTPKVEVEEYSVFFDGEKGWLKIVPAIKCNFCEKHIETADERNKILLPGTDQFFYACKKCIYQKAGEAGQNAKD